MKTTIAALLLAGLVALPAVAAGQTCGDGAIGAGETCDDGNQWHGDGCDAFCAVEAGATCVGEPSACTSSCGDCTVLVADDFADDSLDGALWTTNTANTDAAVVEQNQRIELTNRGMLVSAAEYVPRTSGGLRITSRWTISAGDLVAVNTRSTNDNLGGFGAPSESVMFYAYDVDDQIRIVAAGVDVSAALTITAGDVLFLEVRDDRASLSFTVTNETSQAAPVTVTAVYPLEHDANFVVFMNRGKDGQTSFTSYLDDVFIRTMNIFSCDSRRCDTSDDTCRVLPFALGTVCDDGNPATTTDRCDGLGTCLSDCPAGTWGAACESECPGGAADPCTGHGTCNDGVNGTGACTCTDFWTGADCATDVDECTLQTDDCDTNATCTNTDGGWTCACDTGWYGDGTTCATQCGDGFVRGAEACDDGNLIPGDGCSATCTVEPGATCPAGDPSVCTTTCGADCTVVVADDFADDTLDGALWTTNTANTEAAVVEQNQRIELTNRGMLVSQAQYDPATVGGVRVTARWTVTANDLAGVGTRSTNDNTGGFGAPSQSVLFYAFDLDDTVHIVRPGQADVSTALTITPNDVLAFDVRDDGTNLTFIVTNETSGAPAVTLTSTYATDHGTDFVVFMNRGKDGATSFTSYLDDVTIRTLNTYECQMRRCDTTDDTCRLLAFAVGTVCDDGNPATTHDRCDGAGACLDDCPAGTFGEFCGSECPGGAATPCTNHGTCDDGVAGAGACTCTEFWTGTDCATDVDECTLQTDDCDTNATCTNTDGGWTCACDTGWHGDGTTCAAQCGDGWVRATETCDDVNGTPVDGDGCSATCAVEHGFDCTDEPSVCTSTCGDGVVASDEECDDIVGTPVAGDGCATDCTTELGYDCAGEPSLCTTTCGDGVKAASEGCDDGDTESGDGCSAACTVEPGANCTGDAPTVCTTTCGVDCAVLVSDDFADDTLDAALWTTNTDNTEAVVVEQNQRIEITNRGFLVSQAQYDPATEGGVRVTSRWTVSANDLVGVNTRSTNDVTGGFGAPSLSVLFYAFDLDDSVHIVRPGQADVAGALTISPGDVLFLDARDDGTNLTFIVTNETTAAAPVTLTSTYATDHATDFVVFLNRGKDGATSFTSFLDDVTIRTLNTWQCQARRCDGTNDTCQVLPHAVGTLCDDGNPATTHDRCDGAGACQDDCPAGYFGETCTPCPGGAATPCNDHGTCADGVEGTGACTCNDFWTDAACATDVDECALGTHDCDTNATCANTDGGWTCTCDLGWYGDGTACAPQCGDGLVRGAEACDDIDGTPVDGDGCSATCTIENGFYCNNEPSQCASQCGDALVASDEECDDIDGTPVAGDGCSATCTIENGFYCNNEPSQCASQCGDALVASDEECDDIDGTPVAGDGCSATCTIENGFYCNNEPSQCASQCGDGLVASDEECDDIDGTPVAGDGCSATCTIENGFYCNNEPSQCASQCGDALVASDEECDDIDGTPVAGDGCSATCTIENGFYCNNEPSQCASQCGDALVASDEECDDIDGTPVAGDGCSATCTIENGFYCNSEPSTCASQCGDALVASDEECDDIDGTPVAGDGCSATCTIEHGFYCNGQPSTCASDCGDALVASDEECDDIDGTPVAGDGCSATCTIENGFYCTSEPSDCTSQCGDGLVASDEECDDIDGTPVAGDGCSATCTIEHGFYCNSQPSTCASQCGDALVASDEECDDVDGTPVAGDGCSATCTIEHGFTCNSEPSACASQCNDSLVASDEECDDGGNVALDGCSPTCAIEHGFYCNSEPSICASDCGDGLVASDEGCDDDGNAALDGCSPTCTVEHGFYCASEPSDCASQCNDSLVASDEACDDGGNVALDGCSPTCAIEHGFYCTSEPSDCASVCNDGLVASDEECDDDGNAALDGCSPTCTIEHGFYCNSEPSSCASQCNDGLVATDEECDDDGNAALDGCSPTCTIEHGFYCVSEPSDCTSVCNDSLVASDEQCDDGANDALDGCSPTCTIEHAFYCTGEPSDCASVCNDGLVATDEECDDDANEPLDGCAADCTIEHGFYCVSEPSDCASDCGDGLVATDEPCDDGGNVSVDGCSATCVIEYGFYCSAEPSDCVSQCGDAKIASDEECDDANADPGDGCSEICDVELGWECLLEGQACRVDCGDSMILPPETCDDGNETTGDGCDGRCNRENGWECLVVGQPCTPNCGDRIVLAGYETCDDGNETPDDGCSATCQVEYGWECPPPGLSCNVDCGDSIVLAGYETCDDGNENPGDGCSSQCQTELGWQCPTAGQPCEAVCGDGRVIGGQETCDDGDAEPGDGCDETCHVETGWVCPIPGEACETVCGDGHVRGLEHCDDGDLENGDGCSDACLIEVGFSCNGSPSICASTCGDFVVASDEACDDGHLVPGDGCSDLCTVEHGYDCTGSPSVCTSTCGDGILASDEPCDDHDNDPGDGCAADCNEEAGWDCTGEPSTCAPICGDGLIRGGERCDDDDLTSGDGCSSLCLIESNYTCEGEPSVCTYVGSSGDLVITEIMKDPSCALDVNGEWIEVYNRSQLAIDLEGWRLGDDGSDTFTFPAGLTVPAGSYFILCRNGTRAQNGNVFCGTTYSGFSLDNGTDEVVIRNANGIVIDRVNYFDPPAPGESGFPDIAGRSMALDPGSLDPGLNNDADNWCNAEVLIPGGCGDRGSPGAQNSPCPICGDGAPGGIEQCDDGNAIAGDGCESNCRYTCQDTTLCPPEVPGDCAAPACVNGGTGRICGLTIDNTDNDDGDPCTTDLCTGGIPSHPLVDDGTPCDVLPGDEWCIGGDCTANSCGDGFTGGSEQCDDGGNEAGDGCSPTCRLEACGNSTVDFGEQCDDGNPNFNDGCEPDCTYTCLNPVGDCPVDVPGDCQQWTCVAGGTGRVCGQTADDTDTDDGDVCTVVACAAGVPSVTPAADGGVCDDGAPGDAWCIGGLCTANTCGDGFLGDTEQCDDGNNAGADGCSSTCTVEDLWGCAGTAPSVCYRRCLERGFDAPLLALSRNTTGSTANDWIRVGARLRLLCYADRGANTMGEVDSAWVAGDLAGALTGHLQATVAWSALNLEDGDIAFVRTCEQDAAGSVLCKQLHEMQGASGSVVLDHTVGERHAAPTRVFVRVTAAFDQDGRGCASGDVTGTSVDLRVRWSVLNDPAGPAGAFTDADADGICDGPGLDNCAGLANPDQADSDARQQQESMGGGVVAYQLVTDGRGDACDNCTAVLNTTQSNADDAADTTTGVPASLRGDACDTCQDVDGDGYGDPLFDPDPYRDPAATLAGGPGALHACADDCDPIDPDVNPTAVEGPAGDPTCSDLVDNDCDGDADELDSVCLGSCGDGVVAGSEGCDDDGNANGDGCSLTCAVEYGFVCTGQPSVCTAPCGDGLVASVEECDDGDREGGDGCAATCQRETGWSCTGIPSQCTPICGDGLFAGGETCDDADVDPGDGCGADCHIEEGWSCSGLPSVCQPVCGDGIITATEQCDDGDTQSGDGCTSLCRIEDGWLCPQAGQDCTPICGDGVVRGSETCDDRDRDSGDGCSSTCQRESGWACPIAGESCVPVCGDGLVRGTEVCDDGDTLGGDGCGANCRVELGWQCDAAQPSVCTAVCGDGLRRGTEECDDARNDDGDGCDAVCRVERGWSCTGQPSVCRTGCGDGVVAGAETCDDGGLLGGDGCSASCQRENGWVCAGEPSDCETICGDSVIAGDEQCDDSAAEAGDGCSATCRIEPGWRCLGLPSVCGPICGDTRMVGGEACDDADLDNGDGCSANCQVEAGWTCVNDPLPSVCTTVCGDGVRTQATEECDDGGTQPGDGCDASCRREVGWNCPTAGQPCVAICGDGRVLGAEQCDDDELQAGDGCSPNCRLEPGWTCDGAPSVCGPVCGDGFVVGGEACDDADTEGGDGCDGLCRVEPNWTCLGQPSICDGVCGDGVPVGQETCDDGGVQPGDGCNANCRVELGWTCTLASPSDCDEVCGDGRIVGLERCDDGGTAPGDGCDEVCQIEEGWFCVGGVCQPFCGDGAVLGDEECDDGGTLSGDGCDRDCREEPGWVCGPGPYSECNPACGDGQILGFETCDDGDAVGGDGCDETCQTESGWICGGAPSECSTLCGDGLVRGEELCDDDNTRSGDGCSGLCLTENHWDCNAEEPTRCDGICGDGFIRGHETCDDGEQEDGDGCSGLCRTETGYSCTGEPSTCATGCGDGIPAGLEACDDGNNYPYDGCSPSCTVEYGYECIEGSVPSACVTRCGDGLAGYDEICDDGGTENGDGCNASCRPEPGGLIITELHIADDSGAEGEYIEIYNASGAEVNIARLGLSYGSTPVFDVFRRCANQEAVLIGAGDYAVIGFGPYESPPPVGADMHCARAGFWVLEDEGGVVRLHASHTPNSPVIDTVDYSAFTCQLQHVRSAAGVYRSFELVADAYDADANDAPGAWCLTGPGIRYSGGGTTAVGTPHAEGVCAEMRCDAADDDCDGATDEEWDLDLDAAFALTGPGCVDTYGPAAPGARLDCDDTVPEANFLDTEDWTVDVCDDGFDNDCDGFTDDDPECVPPETCTNGVDDDEDGLADCFDPDCRIPGAPFADFGVACDGADEDQCAEGTLTCAAPTRLVCDDDPGEHDRERGPGEPRCLDGVDNDCDGMTDVDDPECRACDVDLECDDEDPCTDDTCEVGLCYNRLRAELDVDGDGICDDERDVCFGVDSTGDSDGDDVCDSDDQCLGNDAVGDLDDDGICDDRDGDKDGDGCRNEADRAPTVRSSDGDGDGVSEDCDQCAGDDASDPCGTGDPDPDRDGFCGDVDSDEDADGCLDDNDPAPCVWSPDVDADGQAEDCDACLGNNASGDLDEDGVCNDVDDDDDGDHWTDDAEAACGTDPRDAGDVPDDVDGNGVCDELDIDGDGDGCPDHLDPEPGVDSPDLDGDGFGADCDRCEGDDRTGDTDGDGVCDDADVCVGEDTSGDFDGDGWCADSDCNDTDRTVRPDTTEGAACDGVDDDCNGLTDDAPGLDEDQDGVCGTEGDCDDTDPLVKPGAREVFDHVDNDCDGLTDADDPGYVGSEPERCDGVDNDGDGLTDSADPDIPDADGDDWDACRDCDDDDPTIHPEADEEGPNGVDEDCDGVYDEGLLPAGAVIVTEIQANPTAVDDTDGEWFEIHNGTDDSIILNGWTVQDLTGEAFVIESATLVVIRPDEYFVFAVNEAGVENGGVRVDYVYPRRLFTLDNGADAIVLRQDQEIINRVAWDPVRGWPYLGGGIVGGDESRRGLAGRALSLDPANVASRQNAAPDDWCLSNDPIGAGGDYGTPQEPNVSCCQDWDGDLVTTCEGDCNDFDPTIYTGASETLGCDKKDNDCDGTTDERADRDTDGFTECDGDCDDDDRTVNPTATEICDNKDNDCDGTTDESIDADDDGYTICDGDCNDANRDIHPGATDFCDEIDNDCDGITDSTINEDNDPKTICNDCDDKDPDVYEGAEEVCDGKDNDCDGATDRWEGDDADDDRVSVCEGDCDDSDPDVHGGPNPAAELCDGKDNDCNGETDDLPDADEDGYTTCTDLDDDDPDVHPGAVEMCDGKDNDQDGLTDTWPGDDADGDQVTWCQGDRFPGELPGPGGVADNDEHIYPGAKEWCDEKDNDIDGETDEDCEPVEGDHSVGSGPCSAAGATGAAPPSDGWGWWLLAALALALMARRARERVGGPAGRRAVPDSPQRTQRAQRVDARSRFGWKKDPSSSASYSASARRLSASSLLLCGRNRGTATGLHPRRSARCARWSVLVALLLVPVGARAQFSVQAFAPSPHARDVFTVEASQVNRGTTVAAELMWSYADRPFVLESRGGLEEARTQEVVSRLIALDLLAAVSFLNRVSVGIDLPLFVNAAGQESGLVELGQPVKAFTVGDLRLSPKVMILDNHRDGVGVALDVGFTAPTAQDGAFTGEDSFTLVPRAIVDWNMDGIRVAVNLGYRHRFGSGSLDIVKPSHEITWGVGGAWPFFDDQLEALFELYGSTGVNGFFSDASYDRLEMLAGARWHFPHDIRVQVGAGLGLLPGYGNPSWRLLASVAYTPRTITPPDTDGDGIPDFDDACPLEPEDVDGYMDFDGCPDPDNDLDGVPDAADQCPSVPEDRDGFSDDDGCPETDNDGDGIEDGQDICRNDPEDFDGFQDDDGCPEPDNDLDGLLDADDACPTDAETPNDYQDDDGCPDQTPLAIVADQIVMVWPVEFVPGTGTLTKAGYDALEKMAAFLISHQELTAIRVDAHTDDKGSYRKLHRLTEKRARVVSDTLDELGVAYFRLFPKGFGSTAPVAPNDTEEGRKLNNRIEFTILERTD